MSPQRGQLNDRQVFIMRVGFACGLVGFWAGMGLPPGIQRDQIIGSSLVLTAGCIALMLLDRAKQGGP